MKKIITFALSAVMLLSMVLIPSVGITAAAETTYAIKDNVDKFKINGRYNSTSEGAEVDWSGAGIEFSANCSGDVKVKLAYTSRTDIYFTAYVDGVRVNQRFQSTSARKGTTWTIATGLASGNHTFKISKQSSAVVPTVLESVTLTGTLNSKPADKSGYIEVIGDSISCGIGNLGQYTTANGLETTDATQSYGYLAADTLKSDVSIVALGGIGIRGTYIGVRMEDVYPYTSYYRSSTTAYSFSRKPNVVVLNLGTNDIGLYGSISDEAKRAEFLNEFKTKAKEFINYIRSKYPNVPVVWAYNMMNNGNFGTTDAITEVINELGGAGNNIYKLQLTRGTSGGSGHPAVATHVSAAKVLSDFIASKGWMSSTPTPPATTTTTTTKAPTTTTTTQTPTPGNYVSTGVYLPATAAAWNGGAPEEVEGGGIKTNGNGNLTIEWKTSDAWQYQAYTWDQADPSVVTSDAVGIRFKLKVNSVGKANVPLRVKFVFQEYWPQSWKTCIKPITAAVGEEAEYVMLLSEFGMSVSEFQGMDHQQIRVEALDGATTLGSMSFTFSDIEAVKLGTGPVVTTTTTTTTTKATTTTTTTTKPTTATTKTTTTTQPKPTGSGDVNNDGRINVFDVMIVKQIVVDPNGLYGTHSNSADLNGDGYVNVLDIAIIKRIVAGL